MADPNDVALVEAGEMDLQQCVLDDADFTGKRLIGRDFRKAKLRRTLFDRGDVSGSDFAEAELNGTSFANATCHNCVFKSVMFGVNFTGTDLREARIGSLITRTKFDGADLSGVSFKGARFGEGNSLDGVKVDAATDFEGVEMPRPLSRLAIFQDYSFVRGKLRRGTDVSVESDSERQSADEHNTKPYQTSEGADVTEVEKRLAAEPDGIAELARSLQILILDEIERMPRPNEPEQLDRHEHFVTLLQRVGAGLGQIATEIEEFRQADGAASRKEHLETASLEAISLQNEISAWWVRNRGDIGQYGSKIALLGAGTAALALCGVPSGMAAGVATFWLGGRQAIDAVRSVWTDDTPDTSPQK